MLYCAHVLRTETDLVFIGGVWFIMFHVELFAFFLQGIQGWGGAGYLFPVHPSPYCAFFNRVKAGL